MHNRIHHEYGPRQALVNLSNEIRSTKDQIRNLIGHAHGATDGGHMESILRKTLRQRLPKTVEVKSGFVASNNDTSKQIDVLLIDSSRPRFYEDGDLIICGPEAVVGIIEVKANVQKFGEAEWAKQLKHLQASSQVCHRYALEKSMPAPFVGLFAMSASAKNTPLAGRNASELACRFAATLGRPSECPLTHLCIGSKYFCRLESDHVPPQDQKFMWTRYELEDMAYGYFINNLLMWIDERHADAHADKLFPMNKQDMGAPTYFPID